MNAFMMRRMKGTALTVLFIITISALSPFALLTVPDTRSGEAALGAIDVCSSSVPAVSASGAMPCISATPFVQTPFMNVTSMHPAPLVLAELLVSTGNEQPPRS